MRRRPLVQLIVFSVLVICTPILRAQQKQEDVLRVDTSLVSIPVIVSDRDNRYVPGLRKENFRVLQDGQEQTIEVFSDTDAPMTVILALDTSLSTIPVLGKIKKAAKKFIKDLDAADKCLVLSFDNGLHTLSGLTSDKNELESAIESANNGEHAGTLLNDALYRAVNSMLKGVSGRKALILLTDGKDHGSYRVRSEVINSLTESDLAVYPIFYETGGAARRMIRDRFPNIGRFPGAIGRGGMGHFPQGGGRFPAGRNFPDRSPKDRRPNVEISNEDAMAFLDELAEITGGRAFKEKKTDLKDVFRQIADEMKRQYLIGYYPSEESPDGTTHQITVRVDKPNAVVRSKTVYRTRTR